MDAVAEFGAEHFVDKFVLRDAAEAGEGRALDDRVEVGSVAADGRASARNAGLDAILQLIWCNAHRQEA